MYSYGMATKIDFTHKLVIFLCFKEDIGFLDAKFCNNSWRVMSCHKEQLIMVPSDCFTLLQVVTKSYSESEMHHKKKKLLQGGAKMGFQILSGAMHSTN